MFGGIFDDINTCILGGLWEAGEDVDAWLGHGEEAANPCLLLPVGQAAPAHTTCTGKLFSGMLTPKQRGFFKGCQLQPSSEYLLTLYCV